MWKLGSGSANTFLEKKTKAKIHKINLGTVGDTKKAMKPVRWNIEKTPSIIINFIFV